MTTRRTKNGTVAETQSGRVIVRLQSGQIVAPAGVTFEEVRHIVCQYPPGTPSRRREIMAELSREENR